MRNITKIFSGVRALDNVSFTLRKGEIHALMGENGAGRTEVVETICGITKPTSGEILMLDEPTKGVDVGSKAQIYEIMRNLTEQSLGSLMISSELPEVINMSDRGTRKENKRPMRPCDLSVCGQDHPGWQAHKARRGMG